MVPVSAVASNRLRISSERIDAPTRNATLAMPMNALRTIVQALRPEEGPNANASSATESASRPPREPVSTIATPMPAIAATPSQRSFLGARGCTYMSPTRRMTPIASSFALQFAFWPNAVMRSPPVHTVSPVRPTPMNGSGARDTVVPEQVDAGPEENDCLNEQQDFLRHLGKGEPTVQRERQCVAIQIDAEPPDAARDVIEVAGARLKQRREQEQRRRERRDLVPERPVGKLERERREAEAERRYNDRMNPDVGRVTHGRLLPPTPRGLGPRSTAGRPQADR